MKTLKNKLTAFFILALGIYGAFRSDGTAAALLTFLVFAVPSALIFFQRKSIYAADRADYIIEKSGEVVKK